MGNKNKTSSQQDDVEHNPEWMAIKKTILPLNWSVFLKKNNPTTELVRFLKKFEKKRVYFLQTRRTKTCFSVRTSRCLRGTPFVSFISYQTVFVEFLDMCFFFWHFFLQSVQMIMTVFNLDSAFLRSNLPHLKHFTSL